MITLGTRRRFVLAPGDKWLLLLSVLVVVPHLTVLPPSFAMLCGAIWLLDVLLLGFRIRLGRGTKVGLIAAVLAILWFGIVQATQISLGPALVCLVLVLKPLETNDRRGRRAFLLLCYFGALIFFFQDRDGLWLAYYALYCLLVTGYLLRVEHPDLGPGRVFREALGLLLPALPLALVLFYAFPRLPEPLWQWGGEDGAAVTGVPDEVELHTLSALAESGEVAFRARFNGAPPDLASLYWRGPIYYFTDGRVWDSDYYLQTPMPPERLGTAEHGDPQPAGGAKATLAAIADETLGYRISDADGFRHWLIALDLPVAETVGGALTEDYQLVPHRRARGKVSYRMTSALSIKTPPDPEGVYLKALQLPFKSRMARQARGMGIALRDEYADDPRSAEQIISRILRHFAEMPFVYSLDVPPLVTNPVDEFLFEHRTGYCTHYAAAMTLILRAAGVPARMILGYRGGEWDRGRDSVIVRQKHAHAWVEAWTPTYGWLRVDPTGVIPEERVLAADANNGNPSAFNERVLGSLAGKEGLQQFLRPQPTATGARSDSSGGDLGRPAPTEPGLSFGYAVELAEYVWSGWIKGFDHQRQRELFGASDGWLLVYGLGAALALTLLLAYAIWMTSAMRRRPHPRRDPVQRQYARLCRRLAKAGIPHLPHESYQALHARLALTGRFDPRLLAELFETYERLRYRQHPQKAAARELRGLRRRIRRLRIPPRA